MKAKRVPLNQLIGRGEDQTRPLAVLEENPPKPPVTEQKQLNVLVSLEVHRRAKAQASLRGEALGAVVEKLLRDWLETDRRS